MVYLDTMYIQDCMVDSIGFANQCIQCIQHHRAADNRSARTYRPGHFPARIPNDPNDPNGLNDPDDPNDPNGLNDPNDPNGLNDPNDPNDKTRDILTSHCSFIYSRILNYTGTLWQNSLTA